MITEYYADKIEDYLIVDPPAGGTLISTDSPLHPEQTHKSVTIFSVGELSSGKIRVSQGILMLNTIYWSSELFYLEDQNKLANI